MAAEWTGFWDVLSMKNITPTSSPSVGISQVPQSPLARVGEDWRLRGVAPTATRNCRMQWWHSRAIGTGYTGARGRDSPHVEAQHNFRLSSRLDGASQDERLANTASSDGPVADAFHQDVRERAAQQTHEVAIGDAPTSGQRSSGRARDVFGSARACKRFRPARRSQPEQLRMPVQAVPGDRGDLETQRARGTDRVNGTLHGLAWPRLSGSVAMSPDLPRCVADQLALETSVPMERRKAREVRAAKNHGRRRPRRVPKKERSSSSTSRSLMLAGQLVYHPHLHLRSDMAKVTRDQIAHATWSLADVQHSSSPTSPWADTSLPVANDETSSLRLSVSYLLPYWILSSLWRGVHKHHQHSTRPLIEAKKKENHGERVKKERHFGRSGGGRSHGRRSTPQQTQQPQLSQSHH